jgi:hypothetical protein
VLTANKKHCLGLDLGKIRVKNLFLKDEKTNVQFEQMHLKVDDLVLALTCDSTPKASLVSQFHIKLIYNLVHRETDPQNTFPDSQVTIIFFFLVFLISFLRQIFIYLHFILY